MSGSFFPLRLQWSWSPHSFCHALTTAILSFLACLLPLSKAFVTYRTVLLASYWKKHKTDHITPVSVSPLAFNPTKNSVQNTLSLLQMYHWHCSVLSLWLSYYYYWSLLYSAILRFQADSLRSHVILHEWIDFYSAFLNIHRSGVLTALAWLVPHETTAISARSVYTIQPCTMSLHAKPHT